MIDLVSDTLDLTAEAESGNATDTVRDSLGYLDMYHYGRVSGAALALSIRLAVMDVGMPISKPFFSSLFSSESKRDDSATHEEALVCLVEVFGVY